MKRLLLLLSLGMMLCMSAFAQASVDYEDGMLICKSVYHYEGLSQSQLYMSAHTFLSEWAGPNQNSKSAIEFDDKENATIIAKGSTFVKYCQENLMYGWNAFMDYTLTIRCKDGRCQVIVKVPSMSFHWTANNTPDETVPVNVFYPEYTKNKYLCRYALKKAYPDVPDLMRAISTIAGNKLAKQEEDDF